MKRSRKNKKKTRKETGKGKEKGWMKTEKGWAQEVTKGWKGMRRTHGESERVDDMRYWSPRSFSTYCIPPLSSQRPSTSSTTRGCRVCFVAFVLSASPAPRSGAVTSILLLLPRSEVVFSASPSPRSGTLLHRYCSFRGRSAGQRVTACPYDRRRARSLIFERWYFSQWPFSHHPIRFLRVHKGSAPSTNGTQAFPHVSQRTEKKDERP